MSAAVIVVIVLAATIIPIALSVFVVIKILGGLQKDQKETERLMATGIPAQGRVLQVAHAGQTVTVMGHRHVRVAVSVEVQLPGRQPYMTQAQPLISELVLPSLQPGAIVQLRVDPSNPQRIAFVAPGAGPAPAYAGAPGMAAPGYGQPMGAPGYGQPMGPYGAPGMTPGMPQPGFGAGYGAPAMQPAFAPPNIGKATKMAVPFMILMIVITTVPIGAIMIYTFVDFSAFTGGGGAPTGGWCAAATECCRVIGSSSSACDNYKLMPVEGCKQSYEAFKKSAKAMNKTCK